jgi:hypothetical protein
VYSRRLRGWRRSFLRLDSIFFFQEAGTYVAFVGGGVRGALWELEWRAGVFGAGSWYLCWVGSKYGAVAAL